jgi:signal peptidase II
LKRSLAVTLLIALVLLIDQWLKFYIKTHFEYNEDFQMFGQHWARLHFVENEGMAFGITFDWEYGKLLLSLFRILMVGGLIWYMRMLIQARVPAGFLYSVGLITAGAIGNIIDSAFYGLIFTESPYHGGLARLTTPGQGYGSFLHGKVVDMFYFPIKWIQFPEWLPLLGGREFLFFSPIFNVADAAITCGVVSILLFQRRFFAEPPQQQSTATAPASDIAEQTALTDDIPAAEGSTDEADTKPGENSF